MSETHKCAKFHKIRREGPWRKSGFLRERDIEVISICRDCGRERPGRFRRIIAIEKEANASSTPVPDPALSRLARKLGSISRKRAEIRAEGLIRRFGGVQAEWDVERLAAGAPLRLIYRPSSGGLRLHAIRVLERAPLDEIARPGLLARRASVLAEARTSIGDVVNRVLSVGLRDSA